MSKWITDRLPTEEDAVDGCVLVSDSLDVLRVCAYTWVSAAMPWQPIPVPAPYVKPKRWTVKWDNVKAFWSLQRDGEHYGYLPCGAMPNEAAHRICETYNEVMP